MAETLTCEYCGKEFTYTGTRPWLCKYCGEKCRREAYRDRNKEHNRGPYARIEDTQKRQNVRDEMIIAYSGKCALCGWQLAPVPFLFRKKYYASYGLEMHHIVPVSEGGTAEWDNLILVCPNCHKQADMGLIPRTVLQENLKPYPSAEEIATYRSFGKQKTRKHHLEEYAEEMIEKTGNPDFVAYDWLATCDPEIQQKVARSTYDYYHSRKEASND